MDCYDDDSWASGYAEGKIEVLSGMLMPIKRHAVELQSSGVRHDALNELLCLLTRWELIFEHTKSTDGH